jgi:ATP-dependent DNA helicase RecQ
VVSSADCLNEKQVDSMRGFNADDVLAHFMNSSLTKAEIQQVRKDITDKKNQVVVCCT